ncbi:MAG: HD domain-containing protein [Bacilli bacterium]
MNIGYKDNKYLSIVDDILAHTEFSKTKDITHHGMNRYDHSLRVSYYSYLVAKGLHLDINGTARGALLHDFFLEKTEAIGSNKVRAAVLVNHPKYALLNASKYFTLSDKEQDIILTHMFPVSLKVPRYLESWIVDIVDDLVSIFEKVYSVRSELSAAMSFLLVISLNAIR